MPYLLLQIFLCLLAAFLLGLLIGWLIFRDRDAPDIEALEADLAACQTGRKSCEEERTRLKARVKELRAELDALRDGEAPVARTAAAMPLTAEAPSPAAPPPTAPPPDAAPHADEVPTSASALLAQTGIPAAIGGPDDLKRIWGIGPKMESLLNGSDITTFRQLAASRPEQLRTIIDSWGQRRLSDLANEETWPEQAAMAAEDKWEKLEAYQKKLSWREGGEAVVTGAARHCG